MPDYDLVHDLVWRLVPPIEIPLPLFVVFAVLAVVVGIEIHSLRQLG